MCRGNQNQHRKWWAPLHQCGACAVSWVGGKFVRLLTGRMNDNCLHFYSIVVRKPICSVHGSFTPSTKSVERAPLALLRKRAKWRSLDTVLEPRVDARSPDLRGPRSPGAWAGPGCARAEAVDAPRPLEANVRRAKWGGPAGKSICE